MGLGVDKGANHARRGLGAHGQGAVLAVWEGEHFLAHHVGVLADGLLEQFGLFQDGRAQFAETISGEHFTGLLLHEGELGGLVREKVHESLDFLYFRHGVYIILNDCQVAGTDSG